MKSKEPAISALCLSLIIVFVKAEELIYQEDSEGYVVYCPCMGKLTSALILSILYNLFGKINIGRFGNQADQFLGSLAFAHSLNRTLILPPWVEYRKGEAQSVQIPFDEYFRVDTLQKAFKVILMKDFMKHLAPTVWPPEKRISFCYMERTKLDGTKSNSCNAKEGNPFFSFWETFKINFVTSEFFGPSLSYDINRGMDKLWKEKYGPEWRVIAFTGAPSGQLKHFCFIQALKENFILAFPVQEENLHLHKYLQWSDQINDKANEFIKTKLPKGAFIGIHLRNGIDWIRACDHVKNAKNLFASPQCLGYNNEKGELTMDICMPSQEQIVRKIKRIVKKAKELQKNNQIRSIFVASDNNHMIDYFNEHLRRMDIKVFKLDENNPHLDLAILGKIRSVVLNKRFYKMLFFQVDLTFSSETASHHSHPS